MKTRAIVASLAGAAVFGGAVWLAACNGYWRGDNSSEIGSPPVNSSRVNSPVEQSRRAVDIAICLDTSGSMDGLIESAKQKLWAIVNEIATADPKPALRVALYQYGNDGLNAENGWVQQLCPLTDDLDTVYSKLFVLRTNGGTEYVSRVSLAAAEQLEWSKDKDALKMIVVAGNEPATQDNVNPLNLACKKIIAKGIIINTIFCGNEAEGRSTGWSDAAVWADGRFAAIDQNGGTVAIATPYDKKIAELGGDLNKTYVAYGASGGMRAASQVAQDNNANSVSASAAAERAVAKSSVVYENSSWDLVDASQAKDFDITAIPVESLPKEMQAMSVEQRKEYVKQQLAKRNEIQTEIQNLNAQREEFVKAEIAKQGMDQSKSMDYNMRQTVRAQAKAKGFTFKK